MDRKMPDRLALDWSNLEKVVEQFRELGYSDKYILNTLINIANDRKEILQHEQN